MSRFKSCLYAGHVVHKRLAPVAHAFSYSVFALCLDVDEIDRLSQGLLIFSRNRRAPLSIRDQDFSRGTDSIADAARALLKSAGLEQYGVKITLLCYPRIFGYAFNPLAVYFCRNESDRIGAVIYEVTNTFKQRRSYIIPVEHQEGGVITQGCAKELYVSPFTAPAGRYGFHVRPPGPEVVVGVSFRENEKPVLKTHFRGERLEMSDTALASMLFKYPMMTLKVMAGIHAEAARLWWKGVPVQERKESPRFAATIVPSNRGTSHG